MTLYKDLSQHDKEIVDKIHKLDEIGYTQWPEISHLADKLEDEDTKDMWNRVCIHYNHLEEASIGEL
jgi:hypothetical protein